MYATKWFERKGGRPEDGSDEGVVRPEELGDVPRRNEDITYVT